MLVTRERPSALPEAVARPGWASVKAPWFLLAVVVLMWPRLLSPHLGLLDDGVTLQVAGTMTSDWHAPIEVMRASGRFMPGYWLFYGTRHVLFGDTPFFLFVSNAIVLVCTALFLAGYVQIASGRARAALLAGLLFVLCGPAVENFYTLSKSEVPQTLWLAVSLWLVAKVDQRRSHGPSATGLSALLVACLVLLLLTKETSVVLIPMGASWLIVDRLLNRIQGEGRDSRGYLVYFLGSLLATVVFFGLRAAFALPPLSQGGYTGAYRLDPRSMLMSLQQWVLFGTRDFLYLLALLPAALVWLRRTEERRRRLVWNMALWMGGWMAVFLPWASVLEYHLLPFSLGVCAIGGLLLDGLIERAVGADATPTERRLSRLSLAGAVACLAIALVNSTSNARVQLAVDAANAELVEYLAGLPTGSAVLVNLPDPNEYVYELELQLHEMKGRPDLIVSYLAPRSPGPRPDAPRTYYVTPRLRDQPVPSVRLAFWEDGTREWQQALERQLPPSPTRRDILESSRLLDVDLREAACESVDRTFGRHLCSSARRQVLEQRNLLYGWSVYERP